MNALNSQFGPVLKREIKTLPNILVNFGLLFHTLGFCVAFVCFMLNIE